MSNDIAEDAAPLLVGDNLALDFINTEYGEGDLHREMLGRDEDVVDWLRTVGALPPDVTSTPRGLLTLARKLRFNARELVEARRSGKRADPSVVNEVLAAGQRCAQLRWEAAHGGFSVVKRAGKADAAGLLTPIAEALVQLLTEADPALIRQCEGDHCTLLFHDLTKSRRRRWCSMAACGNRMKVAAFRARQKQS